MKGQIQQFEKYSVWASMQTADWKNEFKVKTRIVTTKGAFNGKTNSLLCGSMDMEREERDW